MAKELKLLLRDTSEDLVVAWKSAFNGYDNLEISCGNIFDFPADAIISPANSFGFMDGGIDLVYSHYFGWSLQKALQKKIRDVYCGELPVGLATIVKTDDEEIKYLISAPTMRMPALISETVNAYLAFRASLIEVVKFNKNNTEQISSILCPGLGTGVGKLSPENCAFQMKYAYDSIILKKFSFPKSLEEAYFGHKYMKQNQNRRQEK